MKFISCFIMMAVLMGAQTFLPAAAASFDCKKAASEVEKLICENPELSRLDEGMTQMYEKARASVPDKPSRDLGGTDWLKWQQKAWLKIERNACATAGCLKQAYDSQIIKLAALAVQPEPKAHRYPDVWGTELPTDGAGRAEEAEIFIDREGQVQMGYWFETAQQRVYRIYNFFKQSITQEWKLISDPQDAKQIAHNARHEGDIRRYKQAQIKKRLANEKERPILPAYIYKDGSKLNAWPFSAHYGYKVTFVPCNYQFSELFINKPSSYFSKIIVRLYPEPRPLDPEELCTCVGKMLPGTLDNLSERLSGGHNLPGCKANDITHWGVTYRSRGLSVVFADLQDGTFLIKDKGYPTVIRFHGDLESPYLATRQDLFLVNESEMGTWLTELVGQWKQSRGIEHYGMDPYTAEDLIGIFKLFDRRVVEQLTNNGQPPAK